MCFWGDGNRVSWNSSFGWFSLSISLSRLQKSLEFSKRGREEKRGGTVEATNDSVFELLRT